MPKTSAEIEWYGYPLPLFWHGTVYLYADYLHRYYNCDLPDESSPCDYYFRSLRLGPDWGWWELISGN